MKELSLHILDIAENSIGAQATRIGIEVEDRASTDRLRIAICDNGRGMDAELAATVSDPFVTTRTTRKVGLGIPLLKAAAEACNGALDLESQPGRGTRITSEFQRSHIDRMPLGDLGATWLTLLVSNPAVHWVFDYRSDERTFHLDSQEVTTRLEGLPLSDPEVLTFLMNYIREGLGTSHLN